MIGNAKALAQIAENKIQAAMNEGDFDNLPGFGKPFEFDEHSYNPNWWIKKKLQREQLQPSLEGRSFVAGTHSNELPQ